jgi:hypothetical protein
MGLRPATVCWVHTALDFVHFRVVLRGVLDEAAQADATLVALYPAELREIFAGLAEAAGCRTYIPVDDPPAGVGNLPVAVGQPWWWMGELSRTRPWLPHLLTLPHPPDVIFCTTLWHPTDAAPFPPALVEGFSPYMTGTPVQAAPISSSRSGRPARRR